MPVSTRVTSWKDVIDSIGDKEVSPHEESTQTSTLQVSPEGSVFLEGWQKNWDQGISLPNVKWLKENEECGLFGSAKPYKNTKGVIAYRKVFKGKMEYSPPLAVRQLQALVRNTRTLTILKKLWMSI